MSGPGAGRPGPGRSFAGPRIFGAVMLALGIAALVATFAISERGGGISVSGPRFVPLVVSIGLIGLALAFLARTTLAPDAELGRKARRRPRPPTGRPRPCSRPCSSHTSFCSSRSASSSQPSCSFRSRRGCSDSRASVRDTVVGAVIGVGMYIAFTEYLGVPLPAGIGPL